MTGSVLMYSRNGCVLMHSCAQFSIRTAQLSSSTYVLVILINVTMLFTALIEVWLWELAVCIWLTNLLAANIVCKGM